MDNAWPREFPGINWSLAENAASVYQYNKGACPQSDELFCRSIIITIPARLSLDQEQQMAERIHAAITLVTVGSFEGVNR